MIDVMIDTETLSTAPDAPVLTIGACLFDIRTGQIGAEFYARMNRDKAVNFGRADPATLVWWGRQDPSVRAEAWEGKEDPRAVARAFRSWLSECCDKKDLHVWGNGSIMDIAILEHWYRMVERTTDYPWNFWNIMDMRTAMRRGKMRMPRTRPEGVQLHNALHDARFQVQWLCKAWNEQPVTTPPHPMLPPPSEQSFSISLD